MQIDPIGPNSFRALKHAGTYMALSEMLSEVRPMIVQRTSHVFPAGAAQRSSISRETAPASTRMGTPQDAIRQAEKAEPPKAATPAPKVSASVFDSLSKIGAR